MSQRGIVLVNPATGTVVFPASTITFPSTVVANLFSGIGSGLTLLDASQLTGTVPNASLDADLQSFITNASWSESTLTFNNINLQLGTGDIGTDGDISGNILIGAEVAISEIRLSNLGAGSFEGSIVYNGTLTAAHTLTLNLSDGNRTLQMGGDLFLGAGFTTTNQGNLTLTVSGATNVTLPTTGTLSTLAGTETLSGKTLTAPKFADLGYIADANGNELIILDTVTSAVNEVTFKNAATGNSPTFTATGGDTNIGIGFVTKGTGVVTFSGTGAVTRLNIDHATNSGFNLLLAGAIKWAVATTGDFLIYSEVLGGTSLSISAANHMATFTGPVKFPSYTVAGVPSAATMGAGANIYVTNETGGAIPAFSDGANWRRYSDRAIIS